MMLPRVQLRLTHLGILTIWVQSLITDIVRRALSLDMWVELQNGRYRGALKTDK